MRLNAGAAGVLQEKEARFRRLAENAPDMIFRYEYVPRPGFTYVNPACTAITGYTPEEYYADPDLDFKIIYPDDRQLLVTVAHNNVASVAPVILRWVHKDGSLVWTEHRNVPVFDEAGNLVALEGIVRDITERKRAQEAVENSEKRFRALIENGLDNISLVEPAASRWGEPGHHPHSGLRAEPVHRSKHLRTHAPG